jgi:hypothetical protein
MLSSDQANFSTNPRKSETNDRSAFERFSVPISNDVPASTTSSFLSQLTVVPTSSFLHFHVLTNATSTTTGLTSLNDVTIAHVSATTATTTATMTQVPATATTNAPKNQIDKCKATRTQHKTRSPSILHPAKIAANNATLNLLLPFYQDNSAIMIKSLLLLRDSARPAITTATNTTFSLQLIVESFSTGAEQVAPATIRNDSFKLIDTLASEGARFAQIFYRLGNLDSSQLIVDLISVVWSFTNIIHGSFKPQNLIVIYFKRSLHFQEDCGIYCEGEWEQQRHLNGHTGLVDFCFEKALQNAKQIFFIRLQQMTKYFVMKECEDIPRWKSLCCDSAFAHKKEFSVFKFPKRFSEFSWAKSSLYSTLFTLLNLISK